MMGHDAENRWLYFNRLDHYMIRCDCMFDKRWEFTEETNSLQPDTCEQLWFPAWNQFSFSLNFHCSCLWFDLHYSSFAFNQTHGNHTSTLPVLDTFVISAKSIKVTHSLCRSEIYQCFVFFKWAIRIKKRKKERKKKRIKQCGNSVDHLCRNTNMIFRIKWRFVLLCRWIKMGWTRV